MANLSLTDIEKKIKAHTSDLSLLSSQAEVDFKDLLNRCIAGIELLEDYFAKYDAVKVTAANLEILHNQISQLIYVAHLLRKQDQTENPVLRPLLDMIAAIWDLSPSESSKNFLQKIYKDENRRAKQQFTSGVEEAHKELISARQNINLARILLKDDHPAKADAKPFLLNLDACQENLRSSVLYLRGLQVMLEMSSKT